MAETQCASGDRHDRTQLGLSEPPPRPLEVADAVHFVLIGCVPASNRRARCHAVRGVADCAPTSRRSPKGSELLRRRPLRRRRARARLRGAPPDRVVAAATSNQPDRVRRRATLPKDDRASSERLDLYATNFVAVTSAMCAQSSARPGNERRTGSLRSGGWTKPASSAGRRVTTAVG